MSAVMTQESTVTAFPKRRRSHFTTADDGMPVYTGETYEDHSSDWDDVDGTKQDACWKLAAVAASLGSKRGEKTVVTFAGEKRTSARWVRGLAKTYWAFQNGNRLPILSFTLHYEAASAKNPTRALTFAHDAEWSVRQLKRWIRIGEPEIDPITDTIIEAVRTDEEVLEDRDIEDESLLIPDIEIAMRGLETIRAELKSAHIGRYIDSCREELDWELIEITKAPAKVSQRVLSLVLGGCGSRDLIAKRAKLSLPDTDKFLAHWKNEGRIEMREQGGRKLGQKGAMGTFWVEVGTPHGSDLYVPHVEYDDPGKRLGLET